MPPSLSLADAPTPGAPDAPASRAPRSPAKQRFTVLPGFGLSLGFTLFYLTLIVLIPLSATFLKTFTMTWDAFWSAISSPRVVASLQLSFGASLVAAIVNTVFGLVVAWVLVRYRFFGKRLIDALVDLPFALPTAVAGIALTALFAGNGWIGRVVRTVQPVLEDVEQELEEAAASLGANRLQTFQRVILPAILPALLTGFALSFARATGEYGSVVFISGNMPMVSEIAPLMIYSKLEQYDYAGATAVAVVMLVISFGLLLLINLLQAWTRRHQSGARAALAPEAPATGKEF
ncbi:Sulfate transport system permease protein CysT [compost metagenome]